MRYINILTRIEFPVVRKKNTTNGIEYFLVLEGKPEVELGLYGEIKN